jgi:hypothetical protein
MRFTLTYGGPLSPSANNSSMIDLKHRIRSGFACQLADLMALPPLADSNLWNGQKDLDLREQVGGSWFAPLVHRRLHRFAEIDVLLLRPGPPGKVVHAGDLDNRLKTLIDALRMPQQGNEIPKGIEHAHEDPLPVLLQDDSMLTRINVETDRLLGSVMDGSNHGHVELTVRVTTGVTQQTWAGLAFL